jgi:hypothetical protein
MNSQSADRTAMNGIQGVAGPRRPFTGKLPMNLKYPPAVVSTIDVIVRWFFYTLILAWGGVLAACLVQFLRS